ncbi:MAG TPA: methyltransferase domain-containing protein [Terracidiphilus sp.]|jgi:SAM-dependent methyltransferase
MKQAASNFRDRDYWIEENAQYVEPSFRLKKCAAFINTMAAARPCSLLDVGCGPAALRPLLRPSIDYFGIDIAIHQPAPWLREFDIAQQLIGFDDHRFDFVTALGFFEYMGQKQSAKLLEIRNVLKDDGKFILSYINFGHFRGKVWPNYNNVQSPGAMKRALSEFYRVQTYFPASHHWRQKQPGKHSLRSLQMLVNFNIPVFSPMMAVEYFFICSPLR